MKYGVASRFGAPGWITEPLLERPRLRLVARRSDRCRDPDRPQS
jgi:hypothetical protein